MLDKSGLQPLAMSTLVFRPGICIPQKQVHQGVELVDAGEGRHHDALGSPVVRSRQKCSKNRDYHALEDPPCGTLE